MMAAVLAGMAFNFYQADALEAAINSPIHECTCHMISLILENLNVTADRS